MACDLTRRPWPSGSRLQLEAGYFGPSLANRRQVAMRRTGPYTGFVRTVCEMGRLFPLFLRFENFQLRKAGHKIPIFLRVLWWARQGLNLRPHPCEGDWRSRVTTLFLRDKIKPRNCPCTRFVRAPLVYRLAVPKRTSLATGIAHSTRQVLAKYGWPDGGRWPPPGQRKTAGRAATFRSGSLNSCGAMQESYRCGDSRASTVLSGVSL